MVLDAGDAVVYDTRLFHHGSENRSPERRLLLGFSFTAADSEPHHLPGYVQFLATPDIRRGQYHVRDFTRAHDPPAAPPSAREAYWSRVLDSKHHTAGNEA